MNTKKGQGLPLNTIIIAIIVLVVLVVIIAIFLSNIGGFGDQLDEESRIELLRYKPSYKACHPTAGEEQRFLNGVSDANDANDADAKAQARSDFQQLIDDCGRLGEVDCSGRCTTVSS